MGGEDEQANQYEIPRSKDGKEAPQPGPQRKAVRIEDIKAEARRRTKAAAEDEGMSFERYEELEKAIDEGREGDYADVEIEVVKRIQASFREQMFAQIQKIISKPWLQTYTPTNLFPNAFGWQTSSIMQNMPNLLKGQGNWGAFESAFAKSLPKNVAGGVAIPAETLRAFRNLVVPTDFGPLLLGSLKRLQENLQSDARAALIAGFATKTQAFLTSDNELRYRWNRPVWHYTNGHALLSILRNGELWASSPANLNDSSELKHGFEIIRRAFNKRVEDARQQEEHPFAWEKVLTEVLDEDYAKSIIHDVYLISASAKEDSLTLWRNYADGDGFAIGIDAATELSANGIVVDETNATELIREDVPLISGWYRVSYRETEKQKLANAFIDSAMEDTDRTPQADRPSLAQELRKQAVILASVMKHEAFEDEREVRWITTNFTTFDPVHYEHGRRSIVPVLHIRTSADDEAPLPLKGLRCSPIPDESIVRTTQGLLKQQGYDQASSNVKQSRQPFKG